MNKSKSVRVAILIAALACVAVLAGLQIYGAFDIFDNKLSGDFSVEDNPLYERMASKDKLSEYEYLGRVESIAMLKRQAQKIWIKKYGLDVRFNQKPYSVFYDSTRDVYLVSGTPKAAFGGTANMLVEGETGLILSVWHSK